MTRPCSQLLRTEHEAAVARATRGTSLAEVEHIAALKAMQMEVDTLRQKLSRAEPLDSRMRSLERDLDIQALPVPYRATPHCPCCIINAHAPSDPARLRKLVRGAPHSPLRLRPIPRARGRLHPGGMQTTARQLLEKEAGDLRREKERAAVRLAEAEAEASQAGITARGGIEARQHAQLTRARAQRLHAAAHLTHSCSQFCAQLRVPPTVQL